MGVIASARQRFCWDGDGRPAMAALVVGLLAALVAAGAHAQSPIADRTVHDEIIYFVLPDRFENGDPANDRGGYDGGPLQHGFDPTHKGFYHGGDLAGLTKRLDYIAGLGATAIWLGPIYQNKPVQGGPGEESAGYHGYWVTDFTTVDAHFGAREALKTFVDAAHARGLKVYLDIITNHTADVIGYRECHDPTFEGERVTDGCAYRSKADYPYVTRGDVDGARINEGFLGDAAPFQTPENFANLSRTDYAYTPFTTSEEATVKAPAWLNDFRYYHNRGDTTFEGENSRYGDFAGLDDLFTEHPDVVTGFIDIFKDWITDFRIDGFRIDTAKHVNPAFWRAFVPAVLDHARAEGIDHFYVFGEAYELEPQGLAPFTHVDGFPAVLDFAFQSAMTDVLAKGAPTARLTRLFDSDVLYKGGEATARQLPTFLGNHDMGRFAHFIADAAATEGRSLGEGEMVERLIAAHALMMFARGVPVIYYGDEQGFVGDGHDQDARQDMFPSQVASYNDDVLAGTTATTAEDNFDRDHPLYQAIAEMARVYHAHAALRRGPQVLRLTENDGGLVALARRDDDEGGEFLIVVNTRNEARTAQIEVDPRAEAWSSILGACAPRVSVPGSYPVELPAFGVLVCRSTEPGPRP